MKIPRWQQGLRPSDLGGWGDVWDAMTPRERRRDALFDLAVAAICIGVMVWGVHG